MSIKSTKQEFRTMAFTVKYNTIDELKPEVTEGHYDKFFAKLERNKIKIEYKIFEKDKKGCIHSHGIMVVKKGLYLKKLKLATYHMKFKDIYDKEGWIKYIDKDQYKPTEEDLDDFAEYKRRLLCCTGNNINVDNHQSVHGASAY